MTAVLTGGDVLAVVGSVLAVVLGVGIVVVLVSVGRTLRSVRASVDDLRRESVPLLEDLRRAVGQVSDELPRIDAVLGSAEGISGTLDSASRLAYLVFSNPLIKAVALGAGTARAARSLRGGAGRRALPRGRG